MIGISKHGTVEPSDLRYGRVPGFAVAPAHRRQETGGLERGRRCNLRCVHCYSQSRSEDYSEALSRRWHPAD